MKNTKPVCTSLAGNMKLSKKMCPTAREEKENMAKVPYSSVVRSLMYLRGSSDEFLCFGASNPILKGYTDADMAGLFNSAMITRMQNLHQSSVPCGVSLVASEITSLR
uniref:Reverse transcriptase Ty1/copia-type domain-containing protein n=1 Tax=Solanum lycopersicum TaxID=4081 RepID=A0A3Q7IUG5_SOLLC